MSGKILVKSQAKEGTLLVKSKNGRPVILQSDNNPSGSLLVNSHKNITIQNVTMSPSDLDRIEALEKNNGAWGFFKNTSITKQAPIVCQPNQWTVIPLAWQVEGSDNSLPDGYENWFYNGAFKGGGVGNDYSIEIYVDCEQTSSDTKGVMDFFVDNGNVEFSISPSNDKTLPSDASIDETFRSIHHVFVGSSLYQHGAFLKIKFNALVNIFNLRFETRQNYVRI